MNNEDNNHGFQLKPEGSSEETTEQKETNSDQTQVNENSDSTAKDSITTNTPAEQPAVASVISPATSQTKKHNSSKIILMGFALLVSLALGLTAGYLLGTSKKTEQQNIATAPAAIEQELKIPEGATVISECAKGRGTQYILPKDIPQGPVYNVHEGKVIGIEYMIAKEDLLTNAKDYINLPLENQNFDHVNVGLLSQGHAGFPDPHYHVDVMMASRTVTEKITCE